MVRFCRNCKRAVDDLDKFCRECGNSTNDSVDYHTYYLGGQKSGDLIDIKIDEKIEYGTLVEIKEKVDRIYQKLFPPSIEELKKEFEDISKSDKQKLEQVKIVEDKKKVDEEKKKGEEKIEKKVDEDKKKGEEKIEKKVDEDKKKGEEKIEKKVDEDKKKGEVKVETKTAGHNDEKQKWPWPDSDVKEDNVTAISQEVNDKLNPLLEVDNKGQRDAIQYLIHKYGKNKDIAKSIQNNEQGSVVTSNVGAASIVPGTTGIALVSKEDVVKTRGKGRAKGELYKIYDAAIHKFIPDILEKIENSKDGRIRVKLSDMAQRLGDDFVNKKPVTLYTGLKYSLFDRDIVVEIGSLKSADPVTGKNEKVLIMRRKNPDDQLPSSMTHEK